MQSNFSSGGIGIRPYREGDVDLLYAAARESVRELSAWMPWCSESYARSDSEAFVQAREANWSAGEHYSFVIYDTADGQFLGSVGLNFINRTHRFANLGYWVRTTRTRRGVATTAARLAARFGISELGFNRIEIVTAAGHVASQRVAKKVGAYCQQFSFWLAEGMSEAGAGGVERREPSAARGVHLVVTQL